MNEYQLEVTVFEGVGHFGPKFQVKGDVSQQPFVRGYLTLPLKVFTQRNFVADFLREKPIFIRKTEKFSLLRPPLEVRGNVRCSY